MLMEVYKKRKKHLIKFNIIINNFSALVKLHIGYLFTYTLDIYLHFALQSNSNSAADL